MPTKRQLSKMMEWDFEFTYLANDGSRKFKSLKQEPMTEAEQIKIVAEFDGWTFGKIYGWITGEREAFYKKNDKGGISEAKTPERMQYNTDWNELHSAWSKLYPELKARIKKFMTEATEEVQILNNFKSASLNSDIKSAFQCLVEGIELIKSK